ncbi:hypothetical protein B0F90DRAFT_1625110 [Multifurca ochricompacta]|uniref:Uncharacterized protein n=1 Tax=Multifurca ochricompacta TaxID=376703 RepID=A0AAD4M7Q8_9AGAM|nr:hypothetical protein B0F90DRAFT_1625110 [Multifurca ochricompacta]
MSPSTESSQGCRIAEILQFYCEVQSSGYGSQQFHCFPIPRIFRLCQGESAIEITRVVKIDTSTGEVNIPHDVVQQLPKAKQWKDIIRGRGRS